MRLGFAAAVVLLAGAAVAASPPETVGGPGSQAADLCTGCHKTLDDARLRMPAELADVDIHHSQGVTCAACHGGDPTSDDPSTAMDPGRGFVGSIALTEVPKLCGSCHSDAAFMLRYSPNIPTDQLAQY